MAAVAAAAAAVGAWRRHYAGVETRAAATGVVGPSGKHDASATRFMITHDFVHKTHLRIFDTYYPPVLSDWWMDDWISHVYPATNANKVASSLLPSRARVPAPLFHASGTCEKTMFAQDG
jgi:hypothetical protein